MPNDLVERPATMTVPRLLASFGCANGLTDRQAVSDCFSRDSGIYLVILDQAIRASVLIVNSKDNYLPPVAIDHETLHSTKLLQFSCHGRLVFAKVEA